MNLTVNDLGEALADIIAARLVEKLPVLGNPTVFVSQDTRGPVIKDGAVQGIETNTEPQPWSDWERTTEFRWLNRGPAWLMEKGRPETRTALPVEPALQQRWKRDVRLPTGDFTVETEWRDVPTEYE
jgi:hypothetical protein